MPLNKVTIMQVKNYQEVPANDVTMAGAAGCRVRWLVGERDMARTFAMREFEVAPGGHTPKHFHDYEHEVYVLAGRGTIVDGDRERPLNAGDVVFIAPNDVHQFRNTGSEPMRFLCLIPNSATGKNVAVVPECGLETSST
ncbi:MAG TPA: cupin domain-containing protein [Lacipirellulaceae bacterium]|nr:cupin domain-containing protein [Lacipirellulaceae bacterium]